MGEFDRQHRVKLVVDEWGPWYRPGSEATPANILEQTPTLRDAVVQRDDSGYLLIGTQASFHMAKLRHSSSTALNSLLSRRHEDRFVVYAGRPYVRNVTQATREEHRFGQSSRRLPCSTTGTASRQTFWGLNGSASLHGKDLLVTVVNPHTTQAR